MKSNWFQRILCSILALVLVLGYVPVPALAEEEDVSAAEETTSATEPETELETVPDTEPETVPETSVVTEP